jgi:hypothetical protein
LVNEITKDDVDVAITKLLFHEFAKPGESIRRCVFTDTRRVLLRWVGRIQEFLRALNNGNFLFLYETVSKSRQATLDQTYWPAVLDLARQLDAYGATSGEDNLVGFRKLRTPERKVFLDLFRVVGKCQRPFPGCTLSKDQDVVMQLLAALECDGATLSTFVGLNGGNLANLHCAVVVDKQLVVAAILSAA